MGKIIVKKILPEFYMAVCKNDKTFEIRTDDEDWQVGDIINLKEWDNGKFTGSECKRKITYILRDCPQYGLLPGYCILAIQPPTDNEVKT